MKKQISMLVAAILLISVFQIPSLAAPSMPNIALNKPVTASSEWGGGYNMVCVNDGNLQTSWSEGSTPLAPKTKNGHGWIMIDLQGFYDISSMIAYARHDVNSTSERLGWVYEVSETADFAQSVVIGQRKTSGAVGSGYEVVLEEPVRARYVRVTSKSYFVIAEIEVYGEPSTETGEGEYDDIAEEGDLYNAAQLISALGIAEGVSRQSFGVGNLMHRSEAAEMAARFLKSGELTPCDTDFTDVDKTNKASGYIAFCEQSGIVSGGGSFRPDDFITGIEFTAMLLRVNGYAALAQKRGYPGGYLEAANACKLLAHVDMDTTQPINRQQALLMMYNLLLGDTLKISELNSEGKALYGRGEQYLAETFECELREGIVQGNRISTMTEAQDGAPSRVTVDGVSYYDPANKLSAFLGEHVYYLYNTREEKIETGWRSPKLGTVQTVPCSKITSSDSSELRYYDDESDKEIKLQFASFVYFIKNGVASNNFKLNDLKKTNGRLMLIDQDADGRIEVIKLYEPQVFVVEAAVITNDGDFCIIGQEDSSLTVHKPDLITAVSGGRERDLGMLQSGMLAYVYVSDAQNAVEVEFFTGSVSGQIESYSDIEVVIDGESYQFSEYYLENTAIMDRFKAGSSATLLLDSENKIVWVTSDSLTGGKEKMGILLAAAHGSGLSGLQLRAYTEQGELLTLDTAENVTVDGQKCNQAALKALASGGAFDGKLAIFKTNADGKIHFIDTETYLPLYESNSFVPQVQSRWSLPSGSKRGGNGFYQGNTRVLPLYEDFPVFTIPVDAATGKILIDDDYLQNFGYKSINKMYPNGQDSEASGQFVFYGDDDDIAPKMAVRRQNTNTLLAVKGLSLYISNRTVVVDTVAECVDKSGEASYSITGYDAASGVKSRLVVKSTLERTLDGYRAYYAQKNGLSLAGVAFTGLNYISTTTSTDLMAWSSPLRDIKQGDVLRIEVENGEITGMDRIYHVGTSESETHNGLLVNTGDNFTATYRAGYRAVLGNIQKISKGVVEIGEEGFKYTDSNIKKIILVKSDKVECADAAMLPIYAKTGDRVMCVSTSGTMKYVIVYKA